MACAGDRYSEVTGNIWSYANRGDMTGVKAALMRDVDVNIVNTAGWTPLHAAAAGGQTRALQALLRAGADIDLRDRGGNTAANEAARGGHIQCLEALADAGVDVSSIRLSQTKGAAVRDFVQKANRNAAKAKDMSPEDIEGPAAVVGYARQKTKSTAFWGPRRTPISTKIKKEILREKRSRGRAENVLDEAPEVLQEEGDVSAPMPERTHDLPDSVALSVDESGESCTVPPICAYSEAVRAVKHQARCSRKARQVNKKAQMYSEETQVHDIMRNVTEPAPCTEDFDEADTRSITRATGFSVLDEDGQDDTE